MAARQDAVAAGISIKEDPIVSPEKLVELLKAILSLTKSLRWQDWGPWGFAVQSGWLGGALEALNEALETNTDLKDSPELKAAMNKNNMPDLTQYKTLLTCLQGAG